jgi:DNA primase|tara:strand:+ start:1279 stop:3156 length:1878 start_codon:yes stop_codon:yes gene_type:complete
MSNSEAFEIKSRLNIVDVVSRYVPDLKQTGSTWKACCPFHQEKTPSFVVNSNKEFWYCYGACSTGGDLLSFIQKVESTTFDETLNIAAEMAGVERRVYSQVDQNKRDEYERLLAINETASSFFQKALHRPDGSIALKYLDKRGVSPDSIKLWELGYAPSNRNELIDLLRAKGFSDSDIVAAGLATAQDYGTRILFSNRLMFPTRDDRNRLIGFGARALGDDSPKYLNTPKTVLYEKRSTLYGVSQAAASLKNNNSDKKKQAIVVEGYMDVISSHAAGFNTVVASNGTAITKNQMDLLKRSCKTIVFALDADEAGAKAALRGASSAGGLDYEQLSIQQGNEFEKGVNVLIASLPTGEDPDSLIKKSASEFSSCIESAKPLLDFLIDQLMSQPSGDTYQRKESIEQILPYIAATQDELLRAPALRRLSRYAEIEPSLLRKRLEALGSTPRVVSSEPSPKGTKRSFESDITGESQLLAILIQREGAREAGLNIENIFFEEALNRAVFLAWIEIPEIGTDRRLDDRKSEINIASMLIITERAQELRTIILPDYDEKDLNVIVEDMRNGIHVRREQSRLRAEALNLADAKAAKRLSEGESMNDDIDNQWNSVMNRIRQSSKNQEKLSTKN